MRRYIDADKYKHDLIQLGFLPALVVSVLDKQPTADVEEVRHGEWTLKDNDGNGVCSVCNRQDRIDSLANYCRYCGAKMNGERKEE